MPIYSVATKARCQGSRGNFRENAKMYYEVWKNGSAAKKKIAAIIPEK